MQSAVSRSRIRMSWLAAAPSPSPTMTVGRLQEHMHVRTLLMGSRLRVLLKCGSRNGNSRQGVVYKGIVLVVMMVMLLLLLHTDSSGAEEKDDE